MMTSRDVEKSGDRVPVGDRSPEYAATTPRTLAKDQDIAIAIVGEHRHDIDPVVEARVVRKIDLFLIPTMIFGYGLVYYDKVFPSSLLRLEDEKFQ